MLRRTLTVFLLALLAGGPATAGTIGVGLTIVPGELSLRAGTAAASARGPVRIPLTVVDARGNGRGWALQLRSEGAVRVESITASCAPHSTCTLPRAAGPAQGDVVLRAAPATGMGAIELVVTVAPLPSGSPPARVSFRVSP